MSTDFVRTLPATADGLPGLSDAIETWLNIQDVPGNEIARILIAFDELLSNIVNYGGGMITVTLGVHDRMIRATIADNGPAFDPLARPAPETSLGIEERDIGGLGLHLVREMMDDVAYAHQNGENRLTFCKTF